MRFRAREAEGAMDDPPDPPAIAAIVALGSIASKARVQTLISRLEAPVASDLLSGCKHLRACCK
jgi:hypothetical protein